MHQELTNSNKEMPILDTKITYSDLDDNSYVRNYVLDMNIFRGNLYLREKSITDLTNEVKEVDKTLSQIERLFHLFINVSKEANKNKRRFRGYR